MYIITVDGCFTRNTMSTSTSFGSFQAPVSFSNHGRWIPAKLYPHPVLEKSGNSGLKDSGRDSRQLLSTSFAYYFQCNLCNHHIVHGNVQCINLWGMELFMLIQAWWLWQQIHGLFYGRPNTTPGSSREWWNTTQLQCTCSYINISFFLNG